MAERNVGRPWTLEEDAALKRAVQIHGECDKWKLVASYVPGRTNKACRKRWLHSLSPQLKKSAWSRQEDQLLTSLYNQYGPKWSAIARQIPGRTDDACSKRYRESLDPSLKREEWTHEEDCRLAAIFKEMGGRWGQVGQILNRSGLACRNRWRFLKRKKFESGPQHTGYEDLSQPSNQCPPEGYHSNTTFPCCTSNSYRSQPVDSPSTEATSITSSPHTPEVPLPYLLDSPPQYPEMAVCTAQNFGLDPIVDFDGWKDTYFPDPCLDPCLPLGTYLPVPQFLEKLGQPVWPPGNDVFFEQVDHLSLFENYNIGALSILDSPASSLSLPLTPEQYFSPPLPDNVPLQDDSSVSIQVPSPSLDILFQEPQYLSPNFVTTSPLPFTSEITRPISPATCLSTPTPAETVDTKNTLATCEAINVPESEVPTIQAPETSTLVVRTISRQRSKRKKQSIEPSRLSSDLAATSDPNIRPYACGHQECWPSDAPTGNVCFATSRELSDHNKAMHVRDYSTRPFKCGLAGCGKSWKNINGLQYHLQISPAHFQNAVFSTLSSVPEQATDEEDATTDDRQYRCTVQGCRKVYRQLSGLKYHQSKGHPPEIPTQLESVPPSIARRIADTTRKKNSIAAINDSLTE